MYTSKKADGKGATLNARRLCRPNMSVIILSENSEVKASTIPVSVEEEEEKTMA
jgi:hypothetical protein